MVSIQDRSERNRVDHEKMIQGCKNPIVEDDFMDFCLVIVKVLNSYNG